MSAVVLAILTGIYAALLLLLSVGILRTKRKPITQNSPRPSVSVIVPMRNEEKFAQRTLKALASQDYTGEWEIICVDDRSTDSTFSLLKRFSEKNPRFRVLQIPQTVPFLESPKKRALETGFKEARGEVLMCMDADCTPPAGWITSMANRFEGKIAIVQGTKENNGKNSFLHSYQKLETLGFTGIEAAGFSLGIPMVASAAALAYKKDLFFKVGGFGNLVHLSSGDDDMLIHKMIREPNVEFCYNLDPAAIVKTAPVDSWKALLFQRARWASNSTHYSNRFYTLFLSLIYTFFIWLLISPWLVLFFQFPISWFLIPLSVKILCDSLFLILTAFRTRSLRFLLFLIPSELLQIPMIVFAVPLGILKIFRWK